MKRIINSAVLSIVLAGSARADMGLLEVWQLAVKHDAKLAAAQAQYAADQKQLDRAKAVLLPQVSLNASLAQRDTDLPAGAGDVRTRQITLQANQALYNKQAFVAYDLAKKQVQAAEVSWQEAQQDLMTRVVKAYFDVLLAQANVRLTKSLEAANKLQWERATTAEKVGLASNTDVLQARSAYDLAKADRIKAENALNTAYENLAKLTGQRLTQLKTVRADKPLPIEALNEQAWEEKALAQNLQLKQVQIQADEARLNVDLNKAGYYPTLGLSLGVTDTAYDDFKSLYAAQFVDSRSQQVALSLNWPLYSGGLTQASVAQARDQQRKALAGERDVRESTVLQVRVLVSNVRNGRALVDALQAAVRSSRAFQEAAEESYKVGLKSLLDVLTARANANKAERDLIAALNQLVVDRLNLEAAAGQLDEGDLQTVEQVLIDPGTL